MAEPVSSAPQIPIFIDGLNVAGYERNYGRWNMGLVLSAANHFVALGCSVTVVIPYWTTRLEGFDEIREQADILTVNTNSDKEEDDKVVLGHTILSDGFYVSNDKKMYKHSNNTLVDRAWLENHRIEYSFDGHNNFIPEFPETWSLIEEVVTEATDELLTRR